MIITRYDMDDRALEDYADSVKVIIVGALAGDGLIDKEIADTWCSEHTVIRRKKNIFRTISKLWRDTEEAEGMYMMVVEV